MFNLSVKSRSFPMKLCHSIICALLFLLPASFPSIKTAWCKPGLTVAVDAGHSRTEPGALSARNIGEYTFNSKLAGLLPAKLKDLHIKPVLINESGEDISLANRVDLINSVKPDLLISIHHDSVQPVYLSKWTWNGKSASYCDKYSGFSIFYSEKNENPSKSLRFAQLLGSALLKEGFRPSLHHAERIKGENRQIIDKEKGIYRFDDLVVLKAVDCPAVLLECGIIKNRSDELLLGGTPSQLRITDAIKKAIIEFTDQ